MLRSLSGTYWLLNKFQCLVVLGFHAYHDVSLSYYFNYILYQYPHVHFAPDKLIHVVL